MHAVQEAGWRQREFLISQIPMDKTEKYGSDKPEQSQFADRSPRDFLCKATDIPVNSIRSAAGVQAANVDGFQVYQVTDLPQCLIEN